MATRSEAMRADVSALLRARHTLLWVVTREEVRVERALCDAAEAAKYEVELWDCQTGFSDAALKPTPGTRDPGAALERVRSEAKRRVYVMRDMHKFLADPFLLRNLRTLARQMETLGPARSVIVLTPSSDVPPELAGHATVIDWPVPDRAEVAAILDRTIEGLDADKRDAARPKSREAAIDAAIGLTAHEIQNCYARSLVTKKAIDPSIVTGEKKRIIDREKVLTWYEPDPRGLEAVGGLDVLKKWLVQRKAGFSPQARARGVPAPKGVLLVGVPGGGKSLTAKVIASVYGMPLLRLDLGGLSSKFVGESEANMRRALATADAVAPCIVWIDEIEKALAGATGPAGDGGVAADKLGTLLSWMQDRQGSVFVIATANEVRGLPPELLRKGRFDELFWVDLPTPKERAEIARVSVEDAKRRATEWKEGPPVDYRMVAEATDGFTGAEIAAIVPDALFAAYNDGDRGLTTDDLLVAAAAVVPLSKTAAEKIANLRSWAKGNARAASTAEDGTGGGTRALDID